MTDIKERRKAKRELGKRIALKLNKAVGARAQLLISKEYYEEMIKIDPDNIELHGGLNKVIEKLKE